MKKHVGIRGFINQEYLEAHAEEPSEELVLKPQENGFVVAASVRSVTEFNRKLEETRRRKCAVNFVLVDASGSTSYTNDEDTARSFLE